MSKERRILAIDFGNSLIKTLINNDIRHFSYDLWQDELNGIISEYPDDLIISCSSSRISIIDDIKDFLNNFSSMILSSEELLKYQQVIDYKDIIGIGNDRILALIGAIDYARPPLIIVSCGTAITINPLSCEYKSLGGAILPGPELMAKAISDNISHLPLVDFNFNGETSAKNTKDAVNSGILNGLAGAINELIKKIINEEFNSTLPKIILTGGWAYLVKDKIEHKASTIENLVLRGLERLTIDYIKQNNIDYD